MKQLLILSLLSCLTVSIFSQEVFTSTQNKFRFTVPRGYYPAEKPFESNEVSVYNPDLMVAFRAGTTPRPYKGSIHKTLAILNKIMEEAFKENFNNPKIIKKGVSNYYSDKAIYYHIQASKVNKDDFDYFICYCIYHNDKQILIVFSTKKEKYSVVVPEALKVMSTLKLLN